MATKQILVIDDDESIVSLLTEVFVTSGYAVRSACNGLEGLREVEESLPDLIILDMKMPVMNGWDFMARFHEVYDSLRPVLVMTAAYNPELRAREVCASAWLPKTFGLSELLTTVGDLLRANDPS